MIWLLAAGLLLAAAAIVTFIAGGGLTAATIALDAALSRRALRELDGHLTDAQIADAIRHAYAGPEPASEPRDTP
jgi:hypothetical protein